MSQITIGITRSRKGILFNIEATPQVEEFFSANHEKRGDIQPAVLSGRLWEPTGEEDLLVYPLPDQALAGSVNLDAFGEAIRLDRVGGVLLDDPEVGPCVNLSPLRLVGISKPGGVSFRYEGVFTTPYLQSLLRRWQEASARFYVSLLKPVNLTARVVKED